MLSLTCPTRDFRPLPGPERPAGRERPLSASPQSSSELDSALWGAPLRVRCRVLGSQSPRGTAPQWGVSCMANERRIRMVAQQIQRELADMLMRDQVLREAISPEESLGADMYLSSVATISEVEVSRDLQVAKVYLSVYGDERGQELAIEGLQSRAKYVRAGLGKRMKLRATPEIRFILDESLERGSRVLSILSQLKDEREKLGRGEKVIRRDVLDEEDFYGDEVFDDIPINFRSGNPSPSKASDAANKENGGS